MVSLSLRSFDASLTAMLGFEEALIMKSRDEFPGACVAAKANLPKISRMIEKLIHPLYQKKGIEAFHANLLDARFRIQSGNLLKYREVEVVLVSSTRVGDRTPPKLSNLMLTEFSGIRRHQRFLRDFEVI